MTNSLDAAMNEILGKDNPYLYTVVTYVQRLIAQYKLQAQYEACDVLLEAYIRGRNQIAKGTAIYNPHAWLRQTALNIIREWSRQRKSTPTDPEILSHRIRADNEPMADVLERETLNELRKTLIQLAKADPEAFHLLYLRTIERLSWEQISEQLTSEGHVNANPASLRQKLSRAKRQFRRIFHTPIQ